MKNHDPQVPPGMIDIAEDILPEVDALPDHLIWKSGVGWVDASGKPVASPLDTTTTREPK